MICTASPNDMYLFPLSFRLALMIVYSIVNQSFVLPEMHVSIGIAQTSGRWKW